MVLLWTGLQPVLIASVMLFPHLEFKLEHGLFVLYSTKIVLFRVYFPVVQPPQAHFFHGWSTKCPSWLPGSCWTATGCRASTKSSSRVRTYSWACLSSWSPRRGKFILFFCFALCQGLVLLRFQWGCYLLSLVSIFFLQSLIFYTSFGFILVCDTNILSAHACLYCML